ncbi:DNA cytosine methyltransferase [Microbacterium sp. NPDC088619]|uniref:DNA cytosine methyltransferase n=1 Tax=Microbacterium sp. NPDC088619 TaxID=3364196 RepID=UPI003826C2EC
MAVDEVFNASPEWFCEFDAAPSKVLAHHFPDVPNFGDVRSVDWATTERVNILAGGFPCQDVSLAGRRRGMKDGTRSGLWSEYAKAIDEIRPDWVVIENVRGLLSADATVELEPCALCVGDDPGHVLRALGAVLGDLADLGFHAEWIGLRAADIGAPHGRFRVFILAWPIERTAANADGGIEQSCGARSDQRGLPISDGSRDRARHPSLKLLSTPDTVPEAPNTGSNSHKAGNIVGLGNQVMSLLPTPRTTDMNGPGAHGEGGIDLRTAVTMMPTPRATRGGSATEMAYAMGGTRSDDDRPQGVVAPGSGWGPYADAIARWEAVLRRPAPSPVRMDGKGGKARLNPELTEWMMGWPAGWVTAPEIGLSRAEQLKACGNGVVPQQAAAALRMMLARPGVPSLEQVSA